MKGQTLTKKPKTEQVCLRVTPAQLAKLRDAQVMKTAKLGRAVSIQNVILDLIEEMKVETPSDWQKLGFVLNELVTSQPAEMSLEQVEAHTKKVRSIKRRDYGIHEGYKYSTPTHYYQYEAD